jgi:hypothetical protein
MPPWSAPGAPPATNCSSLNSACSITNQTSPHVAEALGTEFGTDQAQLHDQTDRRTPGPCPLDGTRAGRADSTVIGLGDRLVSGHVRPAGVPCGGRGWSRKVARKAPGPVGGRVRLAPQPPQEDHHSGGTTWGQIRSIVASPGPSCTWDWDSGRWFAFVLVVCAVVCFNRL